MAGSAAAGLVAALGLNLIYRRIQSEWPENYFSLTDYRSYVKALMPSRYIVFRFGPVILIGLFGVRRLDALGWPVWPFAAVTFAAHVGVTSLRAVWRIGPEPSFCAHRGILQLGLYPRLIEIVHLDGSVMRPLPCMRVPANIRIVRRRAVNGRRRDSPQRCP